MNIDNTKKVCKYCNGEGGREVAIESDSDDFGWTSDGSYWNIGWKDCKKCKGTGFINNDEKSSKDNKNNNK